jgi:hypothetical protein
VDFGLYGSVVQWRTPFQPLAGFNAIKPNAASGYFQGHYCSTAKSPTPGGQIAMTSSNPPVLVQKNHVHGENHAYAVNTAYVHQ